MAIGVILFILFVFVTLAFICIAVMFPEWVGITGKKAKEYMKQHEGDVSSPVLTQDAPTTEEGSKF